MNKNNKKRSPFISPYVQRNDWARWAGWVAIFSIVGFIVLVFMAIRQYPGYSFSNNFLSDLGVYPASAQWFNSASVLAGLSVVFFAVAIHKSRRYAVPKVALLFLALAGFFLAGVGLYPENLPPLHELASGGFFLFTAHACLLAGNNWRKAKPALGWAGLIAGALLVAFVILSVLSQQPLLQKIAVGATALGYFLLGVGIVHDHLKK